MGTATLTTQADGYLQGHESCQSLAWFIAAGHLQTPSAVLKGPLRCCALATRSVGRQFSSGGAARNDFVFCLKLDVPFVPNLIHHCCVTDPAELQPPLPPPHRYLAIFYNVASEHTRRKMDGQEVIPSEPAAVENIENLENPDKLESDDHHIDTSNIVHGKRKRPDEEAQNKDEDDDSDSDYADEMPSLVAPMTKSQLKKLKRRKLWEDNKAERRLKRKDKRHQRQARRRVAREEEIAAAIAEGREPVLPGDNQRTRPRSRVPVAVIVDCQFEKYMNEAELLSMSNQVTRCYSDNKTAQHPVHLYVSSFGGYVKERNETVLNNQHLKWKGIHLCENDFVEVAGNAKEAMAGSNGGEMIDLLQQGSSAESVSLAPPASSNNKKAQFAPTPEPEAEDVDKSIVYLTADSPYTLDRLEPNTTYVIGGIIDKNREKGLCYRIAREKKVRTAKLPIGEYMVLQHRHVLATNHVLEIMLKWLETGDWGSAFMHVIPTRKGGKLKTGEGTPSENVEEVGESREDITTQDDVPVKEMGQLDAQNSTPTSNDVVEVEGDNAQEGLVKNALDEPRWSAPPLELRAAEEEKENPDNTMTS